MVSKRKIDRQPSVSSIESVGEKPPSIQSTPSRKVSFPIFNECAQYTLDPYWQHIFEECAKGKFPRGCSIDSEGVFMYFKNKNGNTTSFRVKGDPEVLFMELKQQFLDSLGLKSKNDHLVIQEEFNSMCKDLQESYKCTWDKIKGKKMKDPIVRKYIIKLKEEYELDKAETTQLAQILKLGFLFNWIGNNQIEYEDQQIINIKSLHFDEETRLFDLDEPPVKMKREYKPKLIKLSSLWLKHLETPKNSYIL